MKICRVCANQFDTRECPVCKKRRDSEYREKNREKIKSSRANHYIVNAKKHSERSKAYYAANIEKCRSNMAAWRKANPDKSRAIKAAWKAANRERVNASSARRYAANPEKHKSVCKAWRLANSSRVKENTAKWASANPELIRIYVQNRRSKKNGGKLSKGLAGKLFKLQRGKCACGCKQPLGDNYHLDHIMPLALGGTNTDDNIQLLRSSCNLQKNAKHPVDFMQQRGFLL